MSLGLERAGLVCSAHAENAEFPRRVLKARFPNVPLYGDVTELDGAALVAAHGPITLLAGGSPCQDLSIAGKRAGLAGARSGLFHQQMRLWRETAAPYCLWENVRGALSSNHGADFAEVLSEFVGARVDQPRDKRGRIKPWPSSGRVVGPAGVAAWRLLDAQWFGVPQRRLRVFVLGARPGQRDPGEVLLEPQSVRGDSPSCREAREGTAVSLGAGSIGPSDVADPITGVEGRTYTHEGTNNFRLHNVVAFDERVVAPCLTIGAHTAAPGLNGQDQIQFATAIMEATVIGTLEAREHGGGFPGSDGAMSGRVQTSNGIPRRLLPVECERLMSWDDGWTDVPDAKGKPASDSARYKACGNGVASNVAQWIGERLVAAIDA